MPNEITCPKCSYSFPLDEALNRDLELQIRAELSENFRKKELDLRREIEREATESATRSASELRTKLEVQSTELQKAREQELALLRIKAELEAKGEKADLELQRKLSEERDKIWKAAQTQVFEEHRLRDADKTKQLEDLRHQIEDLKRKAEVGSQQLQGDVQYF